MVVINKHWPRRNGVKIREAVATINAAIAPRKVSAGWLYRQRKGIGAVSAHAASQRGRQGSAPECLMQDVD